MKLEELTLDAAERILTDDDSARRYEREALYPGPSTLTEEEIAAIKRVVAKNCHSGREELNLRFQAYLEQRRLQLLGEVDAYRLAAARRGRPKSEEKMAEAQEDITFVFEADDRQDGKASWRAELTIPAAASAETMLPLVLNAGDGTPLDGIFKIAGIALPVTRGSAMLPLGVFLSGMREAEVEFSSLDAKSTKGSLVFF